MKITLKNILHYLEGNLKMLGDRIYLLSDHEKEQIAYRAMICKEDCVKLEYCVYCGCDLPGKFYVKESCNGGERFPNLMSKADWNKFKIKNNIILE
jgi:hypothetical protein